MPPGVSFSTAAYDRIDESRFRRVADEPLSTFSIDVDTASYSNVRRFLNRGTLPPADAVRIEELVNYFRFPYDKPRGSAPVAITSELAACPWNPGHRLALVGILQVVVDAQAGVIGVKAATDALPRLHSTLGNPVVLSAYLVLGVPLVVLEVLCARRREEREFWLIASTLVLVGVLLSQTRLALLALWLTGAIFSWGVSRRAFRRVVGAAFGFLALLVATGTFRFEAADLQREFARRTRVAAAVVSETLASPRGLVGVAPGKGAESAAVVPVAAGGPGHEVANENMHLTLMQRTGLIGWALMMWVIGAALTAIGRASVRVEDRRLALTLWAIFSAGLGFLVSMVNLNTFYNPTLQVLFWGLLGIGMAIATHFGNQRPTFNVIYRFGQGE